MRNILKNQSATQFLTLIMKKNFTRPLYTIYQTDNYAIDMYNKIISF